jgi:hypothetical protein
MPFARRRLTKHVACGPQLKADRDPRVAAEALPCAQQLLVFAPELVSIRDLLPELQAFLATAPPFLRAGADTVCARSAWRRR